jgi:hypothetical protein
VTFDVTFGLRSGIRATFRVRATGPVGAWLAAVEQYVRQHGRTPTDDGANVTAVEEIAR